MLAFANWTASVRENVFDLLPSTDFLFVNEAEIKGLSGGGESGGRGA
jgi:sugar/nucleoside kinase (ribokinase family)